MCAQKRGLPHIHILVRTKGVQPLTPAGVDLFVRADLPDATLEPELHRLVAKHMIHKWVVMCAPIKHRARFRPWPSVVNVVCGPTALTLFPGVYPVDATRPNPQARLPRGAFMDLLDGRQLQTASGGSPSRASPLPPLTTMGACSTNAPTQGTATLPPTAPCYSSDTLPTSTLTLPPAHASWGTCGSTCARFECLPAWSSRHGPVPYLGTFTIAAPPPHLATSRACRGPTWRNFRSRSQVPPAASSTRSGQQGKCCPQQMAAPPPHPPMRHTQL